MKHATHTSDSSVIHIDPAAPEPLWRQIEAGVRRLVATGAWNAERAVPSVRELSRELRVNPATVSKAYQKLKDADVLTVRRGEGTFVASKPPRYSKTEVRSALGDRALRYASFARTLGASEADAQEALRQAWAALTGSAPEPSSETEHPQGEDS